MHHQRNLASRSLCIQVPAIQAPSTWGWRWRQRWRHTAVEGRSQSWRRISWRKRRCDYVTNAVPGRRWLMLTCVHIRKSSTLFGFIHIRPAFSFWIKLLMIIVDVVQRFFMSTVIFAALVRVWASRDTTLLRTIFRTVSEQFFFQIRYLEY